jgi:hypothetical protein
MYRTKDMTPQVEAEMRHELLVWNTQRYLANKELAEREAGLRVEAQLEGELVMQKILEENRQKAVIEENRQRLEANQTLEKDLERRFFNANPAATIGNWQNAKSEILRNYFISRLEAEQSSDDLMRSSGNYSQM